MNGREREGKKRGEIEKAACSAGVGAYKRADVGGAYGVRESEHVRAVSGVYCNRLFGTLSVCRDICRIKAQVPLSIQ